MKTLRKLSLLTTMFVITGLALNFGGCSEQSPFQPVDSEDESAVVSPLAKKPAKKDNGKETGTGDTSQEEGNVKVTAKDKDGESRYSLGGGS